MRYLLPNLYLSDELTATVTPEMSTQREYIDKVSTYMLTLFLQELAKRTDGQCDSAPMRPDFISDDCAKDCDSIINTMVAAFLHPGRCFPRVRVMR